MDTIISTTMRPATKEELIKVRSLYNDDHIIIRVDKKTGDIYVIDLNNNESIIRKT